MPLIPRNRPSLMASHRLLDFIFHLSDLLLHFLQRFLRIFPQAVFPFR